jgi:pimeloyl-ACP methyl ester carboxylesterase
VLVGFEKQSTPPPLVILSHGFNRSKEDWRGRIPELAARGYFAVALDNRGHGERTGPDFLSRTKRDGKWEILAIRQLIEETAGDIRTVVDGILRKANADKERIGLMGVSMGAFASLKAAVLDTRIRAVISNIGSPYWDDVFAGSVEEGDPDRRRILADFAAGRQPAAFPDRFFPKAILFQVGELDPHLDPGRVRDFARRLGKIYSAMPERVQCLEFPGITHEFTPAMWENTLGWFERFLLSHHGSGQLFPSASSSRVRRLTSRGC